MQAICSTASEFLCNPSKGRKLSSCNNETEYDFQAAAEVSRVSFINSPPMCLFTTSKLERGRVGAAEPNFCVETETLALKQFSAFLGRIWDLNSIQCVGVKILRHRNLFSTSKSIIFSWMNIRSRLKSDLIEHNFNFVRQRFTNTRRTVPRICNFLACLQLFSDQNPQEKPSDSNLRLYM